MRFVDNLDKYRYKEGRYKGNIDRKKLLGEKILFYDIDNNIDTLTVTEIIDDSYVKVLYHDKEKLLTRRAFLYENDGYKTLFNDNGIYPYKYSLNQRIPGIENLEVVERKRENGVRLYKLYDHNTGFDMRKKCYRNGIESDCWITEYQIKNKKTSSLTGQYVQEGINDIATTNPELVKYFKNINDTKIYSYNSTKRVNTICPECGRELKKLKITNVYNHIKNYGHLSCLCQDGISLPNKFIASLLEFLEEPFEREEYVVDINGNSYYYDISLIQYNCKIEMDGGLGHLGGTVFSNSNKSLDECIQRDKNKDEYASKTNNCVIRINANKSNLDYLRNEIIKSKLIDIIPKIKYINDEDWKKIYGKATSNLCKEVCEYYSLNNHLQYKDIAKYFKISKDTVYKFLKIGNEVGWCKYVPNEGGCFISQELKDLVINRFLCETKKPEIERLSMRGIGKIFDITGDSVKRILIKNGYEPYKYARKGRSNIKLIKPVEI